MLSRLTQSAPPTILPRRAGIPPKSFRIRTYEKCAHNSFRIRTCKSVSKQTTSTFFRINTYRKTGGRGVLLLTAQPTRLRILRRQSTKDLFPHPTRMVLPSERGESRDLSSHAMSMRTLSDQKGSKGPSVHQANGYHCTPSRVVRKWARNRETFPQPPVSNLVQRTPGLVLAQEQPGKA
jgi:hypothetical protein